MPADALAPCFTRKSAAIVLTLQDKSLLPQKREIDCFCYLGFPDMAEKTNMFLKW